MPEQDINTIWTMEYERAQAGMKRMGETLQGMNDEIKKVGKSSEGTFDTLRGWDRHLGSVLHLGRSLLGVFGISGGLAGGVSIIRDQIEKAQRALEAMGKVQVEIGKGAAGAGVIGGPAALGTIRDIASQMGLPEEQVRKTYQSFAAQGLDAAAAASQTRAKLQEEMGGPGFQGRRRATEAVSPQAQLAGMLERSEARTRAAEELPTDIGAARRLAKSQLVMLNQRLLDEAAAEMGFTSYKDVSMVLNPEAQPEITRRARWKGQEARSELGLDPYASRPFWSSAETPVAVSGAELEQLARKLLDAAEKQRQAAGSQAQASADQAAANRPTR